ncbi:MAG: hypothetical protein AAGD25_38135 [Cyanobacteria bacterium P01_F01_bin.150]
MLHPNSSTAQQGSKFAAARSSQALLYKAQSVDDAILATVQSDSVVVVNAGPRRQQLLDLCERLKPSYHNAPFSGIDEIQGTPKSTISIRLSLDAHPAHTDGAFEENPPRKFILQFAKTDIAGGERAYFGSTEIY